MVSGCDRSICIASTVRNSSRGIENLGEVGASSQPESLKLAHLLQKIILRGLRGLFDVLDELVIVQAIHLPGHSLLELTIRVTKVGDTDWAVVLLCCWDLASASTRSLLPLSFRRLSSNSFKLSLTLLIVDCIA